MSACCQPGSLTMVLGSYGQLLRCGPWLREDGTKRDLTGETVVCRFYKPDDTVAPDVAGYGAGAYIYYRIADGDIDAVGEWSARLWFTDADENLPSNRIAITVVADT